MNINQNSLISLIKNRYLFISLSIYSVLSFLIIITLKGETYQITGDLDFYNSLLNRFADFKTSPISKYLFESSRYIEPDYRENWIPTPFYSFLLTKFFLANKISVLIGGYIIGILQIILFNKILKNNFFYFNQSLRSLIIILIPLNIYFVMDSISFSTMSVASFFVILAIAIKPRFLTQIFLCFAAMTRSNYTIFIISIFASLIFINNKKRKEILLDIYPSVIVYLIFYFQFYTTYPGNGLNYIFYTANQGIDYTAESFLNIINSRLLRKEPINIIFSAKITFIEFLKLITDIKILNFTFQGWILKISITLGYIHERLFLSDNSIWISKIARTAYSTFFLIPSFYFTNILLFTNKINSNEKFIL